MIRIPRAILLLGFLLVPPAHAGDTPACALGTVQHRLNSILESEGLEPTPALIEVPDGFDIPRISLDESDPAIRVRRQADQESSVFEAGNNPRRYRRAPDAGPVPDQLTVQLAEGRRSTQAVGGYIGGGAYGDAYCLGRQSPPCEWVIKFRRVSDSEYDRLLADAMEQEVAVAQLLQREVLGIRVARVTEYREAANGAYVVKEFVPDLHRYEEVTRGGRQVLERPLMTESQAHDLADLFNAGRTATANHPHLNALDIKPDNLHWDGEHWVLIDTGYSPAQDRVFELSENTMNEWRRNFFCRRRTSREGCVAYDELAWRRFRERVGYESPRAPPPAGGRGAEAPGPTPRLEAGEPTPRLGQPPTPAIETGARDAGRTPVVPQTSTGASPARVSAPGNRPDAHGSFNRDEAVPARYRTDAGRFRRLASDPDHNGAINAGSRREAMAGLEAESAGLIPGPLERGPGGIEYYDSSGIPWDVKTPPSPPPGARWSFRTSAAGRSIKSQLEKTFRHRDTGAQTPVGVILDSTYLTPEDHRELWRWLRRELSEEQLSRIVEVNVRF